tara:strand:+ start:496 stop:714 length:219 start_codon:yes stop_codon:yes gene_type:complete
LRKFGENKMIERLKLCKVLEEWFPPNPNRSEEEEEEHIALRAAYLPDLKHFKMMTDKLNEVIDKVNEIENSE